MDQSKYRKLANCIRVLTLDAVEAAKSGHPGMPLGMADVATVLFAEFLRFNPTDASWPNRDRLILSAGHGSMLLYSLLYLTGYTDITLDDIKKFRQLGSKTAGHPEYKLLSGIETTTGPLGQGLANAIGMALARCIKASSLQKPEMLDHKTYIIVGDGCLMEGISHEACSLTGHLKLKNLIVLYDSNNITIDGSKALADSDNVAKRFQAYGWHTQEIDGHNFDEIRLALQTANNQADKPNIIICKTIIAFGAPTKANSCAAHGAPLGATEVKLAKQTYGWPDDKTFYIPDDLLSIWRKEIGKRSIATYDAWKKSFEELSIDQQNIFSPLTIDLGKLNDAIFKLKENYSTAPAPEATRESSGKTLTELFKFIPFIGGSADLSESNYTKLPTMSDITAENFHGNYLHYGIREHAMGGIMNGLALYGSFIPYGGSFLVFMDYAKPPLRMAALMGIQTIYIMTHDSIGVGEDGPTHQPIEQLAYLRSVPNVKVFRPCDGIETAECFELAIKNSTGPNIMCLTRQKVAQVRKTNPTKENLCAKGTYIISDCTGKPSVTIFATGSEVAIALEAQQTLHAQKISTRVVSVPCFEIFEEQDEEYQALLLKNDSIKIAIEAGTRFGWDRYIDRDGIFVGMNSFGASAPSNDLFNFFHINAKNVVKLALNALKNIQQ